MSSASVDDEEFPTKGEDDVNVESCTRMKSGVDENCGNCPPSSTSSTPKRGTNDHPPPASGDSLESTANLDGTTETDGLLSGHNHKAEESLGNKITMGVGLSDSDISKETDKLPKDRTGLVLRDIQKWMDEQGTRKDSDGSIIDEKSSSSQIEDNDTFLNKEKPHHSDDSFNLGGSFDASHSGELNTEPSIKCSRQQGHTSDYSSLSSCDSSRKSDTIISLGLLGCPDNGGNHGQSDESLITLLQRKSSDLTVSSQLQQPLTPTGSCLKAGGNKSAPPTGGAHVQFETPCNGGRESFVSENGKPPQHSQSEGGSKFWSRLHPDSLGGENNNPFSSLKKQQKKKRIRQSSGSSTTSIGSSSTNTSEFRPTEFERRAPDGGWGWVVVFASFMVHCIADGVTMSFGVLYVEFLSYFEESKSLTSWVGSLFMAIPLLAGPLASLLTDRYGCRTVTIWGAVIACIGFFISAFVDSLIILFITVGIITGLGLAVCYVAAIVIVAFYFEKYRSLATGIAVAGSGIGTFLFAPIIQHLLEQFGWRGCLIILAGIFLNMAVCGSLMRDLAWTRRLQEQNRPSSTNTTTSCRRCSVTQSSDTLGMRRVSPSGGGVATSTTLPSLDELRRLVQSGEITSALSQEEAASALRHNTTRSESLVLLPTFLNNTAVPRELLPCLSSRANAYEVVSHVYPHLLSRSLSRTLEGQSGLPAKDSTNDTKCLMAQRLLQEHDVSPKGFDEEEEEDEDDDEEEEEEEGNEGRNLIDNSIIAKGSSSLSPTAKLEFDEAHILSPKRILRTGPRQGVTPRRISASCIRASNPSVPAAPLRDMRVSRQSMTFRGAMLNIHRYRLRASSCPNIFRNSIITIAETEDQANWSYFDDFMEMLTSCVDLNYCLDPSYLIFAFSNFILYVFYDTVYMYLTDYAIGVGASPEEGANLVSAIGILNCIGMVGMGYIGDQSWSSPLLIYNLSMVACGLSVIAMPFIVDYWSLAIASAIFGLFISANYALTAVILVELISLEAFSKSYGLLLLIQGIANLIGPPLVGFMADTTGDYLLPFLISGVFIVLCGLMLSFIPLAERCKEHYTRDSSHSSSPISAPRRSPPRPQSFDKGSNLPVDV